jgi:Poxvirus A32 protein
MSVQCLPKLPSTMLFLGSVGSGKSSCLYSILTDGYVYGPGKRSIFDEMVFYLGNYESNDTFGKIKCKNKCVLNHFDPLAFEEYLEDLKQHQLKRLEKKKSPLNVAIVFDDFAAVSLLKKQKGHDSNPLERLVLTSRHEANCSIFFLSQTYKNGGFSTPLVRNNIMTYIIYNVSRPEIEKISEELCNQFTPKQFQAIYFHEMQTPYSFLTIDTRRPLEERIYSRFDYPITLQDLEPEEEKPKENINLLQKDENAEKAE